MKIDDDLFQARQADHAAVNINPSKKVSFGTIFIISSVKVLS